MAYLKPHFHLSATSPPLVEWMARHERRHWLNQTVIGSARRSLTGRLWVDVLSEAGEPLLFRDVGGLVVMPESRTRLDELMALEGKHVYFVPDYHDDTTNLHGIVYEPHIDFIRRMWLERVEQAEVSDPAQQYFYCALTMHDADTRQGAVKDTNQGTLSYPLAAQLRDLSQDFTDWSTVSGDARYYVVITNTDGTKTWGYMGDTGGVGGDDRINLFQDIGRTTGGVNGVATGGRTPASYEVRSVL